MANFSEFILTEVVKTEGFRDRYPVLGSCRYKQLLKGWEFKDCNYDLPTNVCRAITRIINHTWETEDDLKLINSVTFEESDREYLIHRLN